jgi:hypothetical protein
MAISRKRRSAKMQAAHGTEACRAAVYRQRSDCSWFSHHPRSCMARKWDTKAVAPQDVMVKESSPVAFPALHPRDCSSDVLYRGHWATSTRCGH